MDGIHRATMLLMTPTPLPLLPPLLTPQIQTSNLDIVESKVSTHVASSHRRQRAPFFARQHRDLPSAVLGKARPSQAELFKLEVGIEKLTTAGQPLLHG